MWAYSLFLYTAQEPVRHGDRPHGCAVARMFPGLASRFAHCRNPPQIPLLGLPVFLLLILVCFVHMWVFPMENGYREERAQKPLCT